ncbi:carboxylesterase/lipase family protein [Nocardia sp. NPDC088792]|uniref:carboxylesterase/lipase family protein n=1 Tax=Nocardia sp. NPDC088792 TaxID=3364332 RepID=UPI00382FC471
MSYTVIDTATGPVRGRLETHAAVFLDIPYAAPPQGAARFAHPQPHARWESPRDVTGYGPTAPQPRRDAFGSLDMSPYFGPGWVRGAEYLTVNIWAPTAASGRPVMVFVHGGGFVSGSNRSALYDGSAFARDGVVLVAVNYRLGVPGFLHLPDAPDNRGLLDVLAALRWVRDNIAAFGGDPDNVTLFGQSAGATLVGAVLADPESDGLLRRAIIQSGNGTGAFTQAQAGIVTAALGENLGLTPSAAALADVSDDTLVQAMPALAGLELAVHGAVDPLAGLSAFSVVADRQPAAAIAAGRAQRIDLLLGTNTEEGNLYLAPVGKLSGTTEDDIRALAAQVHPRPEALLAAYRARYDQYSLGRLRATILSDALFGVGTRRLADAHTGRTHAYRFTWQSQALGGQLGAAHTMEVPFVFETTDLPALHGPQALLGTEAAPAELASRMHATWIRFATNGDPGWPEYSTTDPATMLIGDSWELVSDVPLSWPDPRDDHRRPVRPTV